MVSFALSVALVADLSPPNGEGVEVPAAGAAPNEKRGALLLLLLLLLLASVADFSFDVLSVVVSDAGGAPKLNVFFNVSAAAAGELNEKDFFSPLSFVLGVEPDVEPAAGVAPNLKIPLLSFFSVVAGAAPNVKIGTTVGSLVASVSAFLTGVGPNVKGDASLLPGVLNENGDEVEPAALGLTVKLFLCDCCSSWLLSSSKSLSLFLREALDGSLVVSAEGALKLNGLGAAELSLDEFAGVVNEKGDCLSLLGSVVVVVAAGGLKENGLGAACLSDEGVLVANENGLAGAGLSEEPVAAEGKLKPANGEGLSAVFSGWLNENGEAEVAAGLSDAVDGLLPNEKVGCFLLLSLSVVSFSSSSSTSSITTASDVLLSAGLPKKDEEGPGVIENPSDDVLFPNPPNVGLLLVSEVL